MDQALALREVPTQLLKVTIECEDNDDLAGSAPSLILGASEVLFCSLTLNAILVVLPLRFVYPIAFRALLNVFVIRIPVGGHELLFLPELVYFISAGQHSD